MATALEIAERLVQDLERLCATDESLALVRDRARELKAQIELEDKAHQFKVEECRELRREQAKQPPKSRAKQLLEWAFHVRCNSQATPEALAASLSVESLPFHEIPYVFEREVVRFRKLTQANRLRRARKFIGAREP